MDDRGGVGYGPLSAASAGENSVYSADFAGRCTVSRSKGRYPQTAKGHIIQALLRLDPVLDCCNPFSRSLRLLNITLSAVFIA